MEEQKNTITKKGNFSGLGSSLIDDIIKDNEIDMNIYYVDSFKVKKGTWDTSAKKREQELKWTREEDKEGGPVQMMLGHSKHFPEFMVHENKNNSIEVTFKRRPVEIDILESYKEIVEDMPVFEKPNKQRRRSVARNGIAAELTTFDAHLQKLAWEHETGYRNYDLNIAVDDYNYVCDSNLDLISPHKPEKIFYIIGQDMYHIDNMAAHTTHGSHAMDVDGRITKGHTKTFAVTRDNIYKCSKIAPVEVIWIPGNHDFLASYMLCFALKEHFRHDKRITIDVSEDPNKARLWGTLLVGWTHRIVGRHNTWSNELAQKFPELWGQSKFREWHHGDQHKKQDVKIIPTFTSGGVVCRQITLSPVDKWHSENVFTDAVPGGESFLWSKEVGVFANFMSWTGQYEENRNKLVKNQK
jgi:hypothetical protein